MTTQTSWPQPCTCTPGSYDDGWSEHRSPECLAYEGQQWANLLTRMPKILASLQAH